MSATTVAPSTTRTRCATRGCWRLPAAQHDSGYCADCHDAHRDDYESPRELTDGHWVARRGTRTWTPGAQP